MFIVRIRGTRGCIVFTDIINIFQLIRGFINIIQPNVANFISVWLSDGMKMAHDWIIHTYHMLRRTHGELKSD